MLVVTIEMWPFGDEAKGYEIGRTYIANDGAGSRDRGDYKVAVCRRGTTDVPREIYGDHEFGEGKPKAARAAEVKDYPRLAYNVWRLIARSILAAFPEESKRAKRDESTLLDPEIMQGLRLLAGHLQDNGHVWVEPQMRAVDAAVKWLAEAAR